MRCSFPLEEGGSATGDLITDKSHVSGCDGASVRFPSAESESFINEMVGTKLGHCSDAATGRFVKPGIVTRDDAQHHQEKVDDDKKRSDGSSGSEPPDLHPFVQGLLKELPKAGDVWPGSQRKLWLDTAASIFKMI